MTTPGIGNPEVAAAFDRCPPGIRSKLLFLRALILETATETDGAGPVEEVVRWGEPSYLAKHGSTVRVGWKKSQPDRYALYFHCRTALVPTFREVHADRLSFEGNRAIVFAERDEVPADAVKQCIALALTYHRRKHLPLLGL